MVGRFGRVGFGARAAAGLLAAVALWLAGCDGGPGGETPPVAMRWKVQQDGIEAGALMAATLLPNGDPLIVGGQATMGAAWQLTADGLDAEPVPAGKLLNWASVGVDGETLVVGNGRRALWRSESGTWESEDLPAGDELWGCFAFGKDDAWAVGGDEVKTDVMEPRLLHRTAAGWQSVTLPELTKERQNARLFKIDGHGPNDLLVVGDVGLALHWDGTAWKEESTGTAENLVTVRRLGTDRYVVVGGVATGFVLIREPDGSWNKVKDVMVGLSGVDVFEDGKKVWVAGSYGWMEEVDLAAGTSVEIDEPLTSDVLHFVLRLPGGGALAGGGNFQVWPNAMKGTLLRYGP